MPQDKGTIALVAGVSLAGLGIALSLRKPSAIRLGDRLTLRMVQFEYMGGETQLFVGWGLKKGTGDFNNGGNLAGGLYAIGGPLSVPQQAEFKTLRFAPSKLKEKPILYLDPNVFAARTYDTYVWVSTQPTPDEKFFLIIDTDASVVPIKE